MSRPGSRDLRRRIWRIVRIAGGSALLALGVIGLFLPVLQGVALILAGLAVLATELPWARRWLDMLRARLRRLRPGGRGVEPEAEDGPAGGGAGGEGREPAPATEEETQ